MLSETMLSEELFNVVGVKVILVYFNNAKSCQCHINDKRKLMIINKIRTCDNSVIRSFYRQHCAKRNAPVFNLLKGRF